MENDGTAIKQIEELAKRGYVHEINGASYSPLAMHRIYDDPRPAALEINTLSGLADYITWNVDPISPDKCLIVVDSHESVRLVTPVYGERNERHTIVHVKLDEVTRFPFEKWMSPEEFNVRIRSQFVQGEELDKLTAFVARIKLDAGSELADTGVSQSVQAYRKVKGGLTEEAEAPERVTLAPYRTFPDLEQPRSEFIFRMHSSGEMVQCGLFEADGGQWKVIARQSIKQWFAERELGVAIIA